MNLTKTDAKLLQKLETLVYQQHATKIPAISKPDKVMRIDGNAGPNSYVWACYGKKWFCLSDPYQDLIGVKMDRFNSSIYMALHVFVAFKFLTAKEAKRFEEILREAENERERDTKIYNAKKILNDAGYVVRGS
jgi:hypothetical protein